MCRLPSAMVRLSVKSPTPVFIMIDTMKKLKLFYQNVRGLRTKTNEFYNNLLLCESDVVLITETWLCEGILDTELCNSSYSIFRRDRGYGLGGGVMILCAEHLHACARPEWQKPDLECIWVTIPARSLGSSRDMHIAVVYVPPNSSLAVKTQSFIDLMSQVIDSHPHDHYMVLGDFNLPCVDWSSGDPIILKKGAIETQNLASNLIAETSLHGLSQYNTHTNKCNNTLDLVFSESPVTILKSTHPLVNEDTFHPPLSILATDILIPPFKSKSRIKYQFKRGDFATINESLSHLDWSFIVKYENIEDVIDNFYFILRNLIMNYIPQVRCSGTYNYPIWYSRTLIKLIKEKYKAHKDWKRFKNPNDYFFFAELRQRQKILQDECYKNYVNLSQQKIKCNPKLFWSYVKSKRQNNCNYPQRMSYNNVTLETQTDICSGFNLFFEKNFTQPADSYFLNEPGDCGGKVIHDIEVKSDEIGKLLINLDITKGAGSDNIPPIFYVKCADTLCVPISLIFNRCLKEGYFPNIWKQAYIVPIHKKGSKAVIENYRPISILNVISKLFERVVHNRLYPVVSNSIQEEQHGFMKGRSTSTNLGVFIDYVTNNMDGGSQVDVIYTDFEKAFDRVDHIILLHKLYEIGIRGNLLRWMESYLRNRSQAVVVGGFCSDYVSIPSGVPQGSILGPLLYSSYLYDIGSCVKHARYLMYADDTKIFMRIQNQSDCSQLQSDLDRLAIYYTRNRLDINVCKCSFVSFTRKKLPTQFEYQINGIKIDKSDSVRDLGVLMDAKLTFSNHVDSIVGRAYKSLGFILRTSQPFSDIGCLKMLYYSYVRSILEYCSSIWNPQYLIYIQSIEGIQNKFLKHLNYRYYRGYGRSVDYRESRQYHHILSLENRRKLADMTLLHGLCNGYIDCTELLLKMLCLNVPSKRTRHTKTKLFAVSKSASNYAQHSFIKRIQTSYNKIFNDTDIFNTSKSGFKRDIIQILIELDQVKHTGQKDGVEFNSLA